MNWLHPETFAELDLPLRILPLSARPLDPEKEWVPLRRDARDGLYSRYHYLAPTKLPFFASLNPSGEVELMWPFFGWATDRRLRDARGRWKTGCVLFVTPAFPARAEVGGKGRSAAGDNAAHDVFWNRLLALRQERYSMNETYAEVLEMPTESEANNRTER